MKLSSELLRWISLGGSLIGIAVTGLLAGRSYVRSVRLKAERNLAINKILALPDPLQNLMKTSQLGEISTGLRLSYITPRYGSDIAAAEAAHQVMRGDVGERGGLNDLITSGGLITAAGSVVFYADKVVSTPTPELSLLLQQTPEVQLTSQNAETLAECLKEVAGSEGGHYLVLGISGGLLSVGITRYLWPAASFSFSLVLSL